MSFFGTLTKLYFLPLSITIDLWTLGRLGATRRMMNEVDAFWSMLDLVHSGEYKRDLDDDAFTELQDRVKDLEVGRET